MQAVQITALLLVAAAWAFALAHAAEYPGKMRLERDDYLATQTIYYPGFTIGGASEPLAIVALVALLALTPADGPQFWLILLALIATVLTHAIFWLMTQPVNRTWTKGIELSGAGARFFQTGGKTGDAEWTRLRDRWERSHIYRTAVMSAALVALAIAVTMPLG